MSHYKQIVPIAKKITQKYDLCHHCLGRLFSRQLHLKSNKILGRRLQKKSVQRCYICKNLFDNIDHFLKLMIDTSCNYSFESFSVGAMIKPSIIDRDDSIRSQFKLKGIDSIKTDITKELSKSYSRKTRRTIDHLDPDVTFTLNLKDASCQLRSKSVTISGRYVKSKRGYPQKQKSCDNCLGKGCRMCDFHGITEFESIQGVISQMVFKKFGGTIAKLTWIGGEEKSSMVLGSGRPFFVKIQNPHKRKARLSDVKVGPIFLHKLKMVPESPKKSLKFNSTIRIKILPESAVDAKHLKKLHSLTLYPVIIYDKSGKRTEKNIFQVSYKKDSKNLLTLTIRAEGGLPIKRFVTGDEVTPGVSKILCTSCICQEFDFMDVQMQ